MKPSPGPWAWGASSEGTVLLDANEKRLLSVPRGAVWNLQIGDDHLIALAPEMREMLLKLEWQRDESVLYCCVCNAMKEDHSRSKKPLVHLASCELGALLEKLR